MDKTSGYNFNFLRSQWSKVIILGQQISIYDTYNGLWDFVDSSYSVPSISIAAVSEDCAAFLSKLPQSTESTFALFNLTTKSWTNVSIPRIDQIDARRNYSFSARCCKGVELFALTEPKNYPL